MRRSVIIAGAATAGGLLASLLVPKARFLLGATLGAGVGMTTALLATKPETSEGPVTGEGEPTPLIISPTKIAPITTQATTVKTMLPIAPVFYTALLKKPIPTDQIPTVIIPKSLSSKLATTLGSHGVTTREYQALLASEGINVLRQTDYAQVNKLSDRLTKGRCPIPGWLGSLVAYGASVQTLYINYLRRKRHNRFDGEWGTSYTNTWVTEVAHAGKHRWRDSYAEWPAPVDPMGTVKWITGLGGTASADLRGRPYQEIIQQRFHDNFYGGNKPDSEHGHWGMDDYYMFQLNKRAPGGKHYDWIMKQRGRWVDPLNKRGGVAQYSGELHDYYQIGYWLVWAAECWRINTAYGWSPDEKKWIRISELLDPPDEWVRHCLAWGVGVADPGRIYPRRTTRKQSDLIPLGSQDIMGYKALKLLSLVMQHTPVPGSVESGTELSGWPRKILDWPQVGEATVFRPTWSWPGGERQWDYYIENLRGNANISSPASQVIFIVVEVVQSVILAVIGNAVGEVVGGFVGATLSGYVLAAVNALKAFASEGFRVDEDSILSLLSAVAQGSGIKGLTESEVFEVVESRVSELQKYWGYADDLIGQYAVLGDLQEQFEDKMSKIIPY